MLQRLVRASSRTMKKKLQNTPALTHSTRGIKRFDFSSTFLIVFFSNSDRKCIPFGILVYNCLHALQPYFFSLESNTAKMDFQLYFIFDQYPLKSILGHVLKACKHHICLDLHIAVWQILI